MEQNKTLAKQLNINKFPFYIEDNNGNEIYYENYNGLWIKKEFDQYNQKIYYESSNGLIEDNKPKTLAKQLKINNFAFHIIDNNENEIYSETSYGYWRKKEFDQNNKEIYSETSNGLIKDNKPKTLAKKLKINKFPFGIIDNNGNIIYYEDFKGYWYRVEFDQNNKEIYFEDSDGNLQISKEKIAKLLKIKNSKLTIIG